jgi:RNA polymerase sigma-70 factor (ECF subfamily)
MKNMFDFSNQDLLLEEIKKGNNDAFEYLFKNYYPRLRGYAARFVKDQEAVRDIIQECFMKIWEQRDKLKSLSILSLLFAMVRNSCLNYLKHCEIVEQYSIEYLANIEGEERLYYADFAFESEYKMLYQELNEQINYIINHLSKRCKEVFILSRFEGLKHKEIAERLQISTKSVEKHISKALSSFSTHFKDKYSLDIYIAIICWLIKN